MRRAWFAAGIVLATLGAALTVVVLARGGGLRVPHVALTPLVGWSFGLGPRRVPAAAVAAGRRADGAVGLAWFAHPLDWTHVPVVTARNLAPRPRVYPA